jgi:hypothetical protein
LARDWKMHPIERTLQSRCDFVGKSHELPCVLGLLEMAMPRVAVTEMIA